MEAYSFDAMKYNFSQPLSKTMDFITMPDTAKLFSKEV